MERNRRKLKFCWLRAIAKSKWGRRTLEAPIRHEYRLMIDRTVMTRSVSRISVAECMGIIPATLSRMSTNIHPSELLSRSLVLSVEPGEWFRCREAWLHLAFFKENLFSCDELCRRKLPMDWCAACRQAEVDCKAFAQYTVAYLDDDPFRDPNSDFFAAEFAETLDSDRSKQQFSQSVRTMCNWLADQLAAEVEKHDSKSKEASYIEEALFSE